MSRIVWNDRDYEAGLDRGVFFPQKGPAEAWNGLISVEENVGPGNNRVRYRDGVKLETPRRDDAFSAKVVAFSHPVSFLPSIRFPFGLSYRVKTARSYRIHLVYNAIAHIGERAYKQDGVTPFSFDISTQPVPVFDSRPASHLIVEAEFAPEESLLEFENAIYGTDATEPYLPTAQDVIDIFDSRALFQIIDNGDGTFTADGPDEAIRMIDATTFELDWPPVIFIDDESYTIRSW